MSLTPTPPAARPPSPLFARRFRDSRRTFSQVGLFTIPYNRRGLSIRRVRKECRMSQSKPSAAVPDRWAALTWEDLERWAGDRSVARGRAYQRDRKSVV